jgi:hypothetical protein
MTRHGHALIAALVAPVCLAAQQPSAPASTAADDHRSMMEQLGIKSLRPGPSGDFEREVDGRIPKNVPGAIFTELLGPPASTDHAPPRTGDPSDRRP